MLDTLFLDTLFFATTKHAATCTERVWKHLVYELVCVRGREGLQQNLRGTVEWDGRVGLGASAGRAELEWDSSGKVEWDLSLLFHCSLGLEVDLFLFLNPRMEIFNLRLDGVCNE